MGRFPSASTSVLGGRCGRNVPSFKRMPSHSPSPGQSPSGVALVSGPRTVMVTLPWSLVTTSSQRLAAMERKGAAPSLWQRQTLSTRGESDGLSSSKIIISHPAFVDAQRFGKRTAHAVFQASPDSHASTNALIFNLDTSTYMLLALP